MNTKHYILSLTLLLSGTLLQAQETMSFSLEEAKSYAIQNSAQIKQAQIDILISEAKVKETRAIGLPQISGEATFNHFIDVPTQVAEPFDFSLGENFGNWIGAVGTTTGVGIPVAETPDPNALEEFQFGLPFSASAGITASQLIFDGSYFVGLKASKAYLNYAELAKEKSEIEIKNSVAQTYFSAVALSETIKSLEENQASIEKSYNDVKALFEAGFSEKQDADQVKLAKSNIDYQLDYTKRQLLVIKNALKFQLGVSQTSDIELTSTFDELVEGDTENSVLVDQSFKAENHIDFRTAKQGLDLSELSYDASRTSYLPSIAGFFTHSQNGFSRKFGEIFTNQYYPTTIVGLQMNVPIFGSGMNHFKAQQAKLEMEKSMSQQSQVEQNLLMQVSQAKSNYESAIQNMTMSKENLALAESIKNTTDAKYKEGLASSLDYAQSQQQYLQTLAQYINTANDLFKAKLDLQKALGAN